ncbi:hypothetical protein ACIP4Y_32325 [Streptomyces sp. NPDC088810]|uniref:hypothetical protein n=1 Tax=Streptomyces sp. NPDC088810 TaxID=3365904 RepID=UPI0037F92B4A
MVKLDGRRRSTLVSLCTAVLLNSMDLSLMGVALPAIGRAAGPRLRRTDDLSGHRPMGVTIMVTAELVGRLTGRWGRAGPRLWGCWSRSPGDTSCSCGPARMLATPVRCCRRW